MNEVDFSLDALHYIVENPEESMFYFAKFLGYRLEYGEWNWGIRAYMNPHLIFIG